MEELRERLEEEGAVSLIQENLKYYSSYIDGEIAGGKSEETVLEELGSPSLIAHSILDAAGYEVDGIPDVNPGGDARANSGSYGTESGGAYRAEYGQYGEQNGASQSGREEERAAENASWPAWVLPVGVLLLVLVLLLLMVIGVFWLLSPILVPLLIVLLIFRLLRGGRRF